MHHMSMYGVACTILYVVNIGIGNMTAFGANRCNVPWGLVVVRKGKLVRLVR